MLLYIIYFMCGILGYYSKSNKKKQKEDYLVLNDFLDSLRKLQHRGRDGYGVCYFDDNNSKNYIKNRGLIPEIDRTKLDVKINMCVGHVKYATYTNDSENNEDMMLQPISSVKNRREITMVHNGNIPNTPYYDSKFILDNLSKDNQIEEAIIELMNNICVSYNLIIIYDSKMYIIRDRKGIRPLSIMENDNGWFISSETIAFKSNENENENENTGYSKYREILPGEIIEISCEGLKQIYRHPDAIEGLCVFEILYFMDPLSVLKGKRIGYYRKMLGKILANNEPHLNKKKIENKRYSVVGVPNSGICAAEAYADEMGISYEQLITKNPDYQGRTFILASNEKRREACQKKFLYSDKLKGRNIILVDDTIVRGNVISSIIKNLKEKGVNEIHVRIPAPPIINRCQLGIAIKKKQNLLMFSRTIQEVTLFLGIETLHFLRNEDLNEIISPSSYKEYFLKEDTEFDRFF